MLKRRIKTIVKERADHCVSRRDIDACALKVLYRLSEKGYTAYLVGGGVRDLLLGRKPKDFDVSTSAHPRQIQRLFSNAYLIGRRFRLVHVKFGDVVIETSTFRRQPEQEEESDSLYHDSDNTFGTPEEDAQRRDFTINALFYDIDGFKVIDHVGGLRDLEKKVVRCIGDPVVRFQEDPVRMLRAVRFAARLQFSIERKTLKAIAKLHDHIKIAPPPRLLEEVYRFFPFQSGERALRLLKDTELMKSLMPELDAYLEKGNADHFWRCMRALDACGSPDGTSHDPALIFSAMLYPKFCETVAQEAARHGRVDELHIARELMAPFVECFRPPRKVYYDAVHMLAGQKRFDPKTRRGPLEKLVRHPDFSNMLALHEVVVRADNGDLAEIDELKALIKKERPNEGRNDRPPESTGDRNRRSRRRRRPRGPRGPRPTE